MEPHAVLVSNSSFPRLQKCSLTLCSAAQDVRFNSSCHWLVLSLQMTTALSQLSYLRCRPQSICFFMKPWRPLFPWGVLQAVFLFGRSSTYIQPAKWCADLLSVTFSNTGSNTELHQDMFILDAVAFDLRSKCSMQCAPSIAPFRQPRRLRWSSSCPVTHSLFISLISEGSSFKFWLNQIIR